MTSIPRVLRCGRNERRQAAGDAAGDAPTTKTPRLANNLDYYREKRISCQLCDDFGVSAIFDGLDYHPAEFHCLDPGGFLSSLGRGRPSGIGDVGTIQLPSSDAISMDYRSPLSD